MKNESDDASLPKMLFKFRPFSLRAIGDMAANRVFLSSPRSFNDAYDCNIPWNEFVSADELKKLAANGGPFAVELEGMRRNRPELFRHGWTLNDDGYLYLRSLISAHFSDLNNCGICSLSAVQSDLKMWAHYADSRRGFCLGFSTEMAPFNVARRVRYSSEQPELDIYRLLAGELDQEESFQFLVTKADIWEEEREYRIFHDEADTHVQYEPHAVRSITFGDRTPTEHMVISHSVLPEHVRVFVMNPMGNSYEFEPVEIERDVLERYR